METQKLLNDTYWQYYSIIFKQYCRVKHYIISQYRHFQIPNIPNISANYTCLICCCCIMIDFDKTKCRKCSSEVKNGDSICCSICNVWHHLHCSGLSREEFLQHTRNKNLFWECPKCVVYRCGKCSRVLGKCGCILCNCCNKWFHKRCSLLENDKFVKLGQCEEP